MPDTCESALTAVRSKCSGVGGGLIKQLGLWGHCGPGQGPGGSPGSEIPEAPGFQHISGAQKSCFSTFIDLNFYKIATKGPLNFISSAES